MDLHTNNSDQQRTYIFPFRSMKMTLEEMGISKHYLYSLLKNDKIKAYYFEVDDQGKGKGKVFFNLREISEALVCLEKK